MQKYDIQKSSSITEVIMSIRTSNEYNTTHMKVKGNM